MNVGTSAVTLNAVICNSTSTWAAGSDGKLYLKGSGAWTSVVVPLGVSSSRWTASIESAIAGWS